MCFTFKKNNKQTQKPVNYFLHDDESAVMRFPQTSIVILDDLREKSFKIA